MANTPDPKREKALVDDFFTKLVDRTDGAREAKKRAQMRDAANPSCTETPGCIEFKANFTAFFAKCCTPQNLLLSLKGVYDIMGKVVNDPNPDLYLANLIAQQGDEKTKAALQVLVKIYEYGGRPLLQQLFTMLQNQYPLPAPAPEPTPAPAPTLR